jgi:hypothetical protein
MVQPAKDSMRNNVSEPLNLASAGRVLFQRNVLQRPHRESGERIIVPNNKIK